MLYSYLSCLFVFFFFRILTIMEVFVRDITEFLTARRELKIDEQILTRNVYGFWAAIGKGFRIWAPWIYTAITGFYLLQFRNVDVR